MRAAAICLRRMIALESVRGGQQRETRHIGSLVTAPMRDSYQPGRPSLAAPSAADCPHPAAGCGCHANRARYILPVNRPRSARLVRCHGLSSITANWESCIVDLLTFGGSGEHADR